MSNAPAMTATANAMIIPNRKLGSGAARLAFSCLVRGDSVGARADGPAAGEAGDKETSAFARASGFGGGADRISETR
jgi:hypothetical protein